MADAVSDLVIEPHRQGIMPTVCCVRECLVKLTGCLATPGARPWTKPAAGNGVRMGPTPGHSTVAQTDLRLQYHDPP